MPHRSGEPCAVRVARSDATLKYLTLSVNAGTVRLRYHNPGYPGAEVNAGLLRGEVIDDLMQGASMSYRGMQ